MFVSNVSFEVVAVAAILFFAIALPAVQAQPSGAPAPGPAPAPTSDETIIDQAIGYLLTLVALVLTCLIHAADLPDAF